MTYAELKKKHDEAVAKAEDAERFIQERARLEERIDAVETELVGNKAALRVARVTLATARRHWAELTAVLGVYSCRVCGCTDDDCSQCVEKTGEPCSWVEADLCSACVEVAR